MGEQRTVDAPDAWRIVLPAGWWTIATGDPVTREKSVVRLLDRQFAGTARDELIQVRVDLDRSLRHDLARAATAGVTQVHVLVDPVDGLPLSASLIVAPLFVAGAASVDAQLRSLLGEAVGIVENGPVTIADRPALRRLRRAQERVTEDPEGPLFWHTHVDYVVQTDPDRMLALSFVTHTDPVAEQLVALFDAIAATLHQEGDGELAWHLPDQPVTEDAEAAERP